MTQTAVAVFRDFVTDGVPASGKHQPVKREIRQLLTSFESLIPNYKMAIFATLAAAVAADITADPDMIELWGRNTPGDGAFGARYIRVGGGPATAWRFQSADGQWWALNNVIVTPEMFGAVSGMDCTAAFQSLATWLNTLTGSGSDRGGIIVNFYPCANYKIWPAATTPAFLLNLINVHGVTFNFNGASLTTDNLFVPQGQPYVFVIENCSRLIFNDPSYDQNAYTTLDYTKGGNFFYFRSGNNWGITFSNFKQHGGMVGITFVTSDYTIAPSRGITLINANFDTVFYPLNFQYHGDDFFARNVKTTNCGRPYFPYGVSNHDVEIVSNGSDSAHDQILLKQYAQPTASIERNTLSDITVRYRNVGQAQANNLPTLVSLEMQQSVAPMTVTGAANNGSGKVRLTVNSTANAATGQTWNFAAIVGTTEANGSNIVTVVDATHIDLATVAFANAYVSGGYGRVPARMKNIKVILDVNDITGNGQPPAVITRKWTYDGLADTSINGYVWDNIEIAGTLNNYNSGGFAIDMFTNNASPGALGTWPGETLRNIRLHDLTVSGSNSAVRIAAADVVSLQLENIWSTSTSIPWTLTGAGSNVRITNVSATNITDRQAVTPSAAVAEQFVTGIDASGSLTRANQYTAAPNTKTANYTHLITDSSLIFNGSGSITLTLLAAASYPGKELWVKNIAAFTVVSASSNVVPQAGGAASTAILAATAGKWALLKSDGTNWQIMASN